MNKGWLYVIVGGTIEIFWALGLKLSNGFTVPVYTIVTILLAITSFYLFSKGMNLLPSGIAYTVFTGIGAAGTIILEIMLLGESVTVPKVVFSIMLIGAIIGLKIVSGKDS